MVTKFKKENKPNAKILTNSLRHLGYDNYSASCDIADNSIDAEASCIKILINSNKGFPIIKIIDNGFGMTIDQLDEALRLGSISERDISSDLGKFGMGLCTASLSIGKRVTVITKAKDGKIYTSIQDVDEIEACNEFVKYLEEANEEEIALFKEYLGEGTGTIIILDKCDNIKSNSLSTFKDVLTKRVSRIFREFIRSGKQIYINDNLCNVNDPLMLDKPETKVFSDEYYDIKYKLLDEKTGILKEMKESIRIRLAILPDYGIDGNKAAGINMANSGFYIMRNNREVMDAASLKMFTKHPKYNRFRGEIWFSANFDKAMGVNFTKNGLDGDKIDSMVFDQLYGIISPQLRAISKMLDRKFVEDAGKEVSHGEAEKLISQKAHLLTKPKVEEKPKTQKPDEEPKENPDKTPKDKKTEEDPKPKVEEKPKTPKINCKFKTVSMGKNGLIYDAYTEGKTVVIEWNVDHPFYERFVLNNKDNKDIITIVDFLFYSLASAELTITDEDSREMIENIKAIMSLNTRILLG